MARPNVSEAPIEPLHATDYSDTDSGFDEKSLSTASLSSSIYDYEQQYGRTYHAYNAGKYVIPNDEGEKERMDVHYHSLRLTFDNKHFFAPITDPTSILDVGTGTGIWAMDVADDFPGAAVLGTDLSPIQPTWVPPNLEYQVADADEPWDMDNRFDLVHTRFMNGFSIKSWPFFYEQAFRSLKPGGWVENQEFDFNYASDDGTLNPDGPVKAWEKLWSEGIAKFGLTGKCDPELMTRQMREAGFINTTIIPFKLPVGPWPKNGRLRQAGALFMRGLLDGLSGLSLKVFTGALGWTPEELEVLLADVRKEWMSRSTHSYLPM
ncbi:hypothetical protein A1O3_04313 [Capronia epimyces CBS 606.96]|uniref:Methyltransferase n=1 Tax=Capronia epimyces CBS 606.96 TaxID=1182542 RepID=W9YYJ9_9EURO|nr:uncharacterized protein A1O3_04313 [Capronia epimyces CBS 606.96]EXJ87354.1 hypothetical protein A1O3_04313 [Capronia epimyces CBS 606.96]